MQEIYNLERNKRIRQYKRSTAESALNNVIKKIKEVNENGEFIYRVTKAILFGSYVNSEKEYVGDIDIAIYIDLKDITIPEVEQNIDKSQNKEMLFIDRCFYGKMEVFRFLRNRKNVVSFHDGYTVDEESKRDSEPMSYIYINKYEIIYPVKSD